MKYTVVDITATDYAVMLWATAVSAYMWMLLLRLLQLEHSIDNADDAFNAAQVLLLLLILML